MPLDCIANTGAAGFDDGGVLPCAFVNACSAEFAPTLAAAEGEGDSFLGRPGPRFGSGGGFTARAIWSNGTDIDGSEVDVSWFGVI